MVGNSSKHHKIGFKAVALLLLMLFAAFVAVRLSSDLEASAYGGSGSVVIEVESLRVLKGENIDARLPMASTTKAMTALIVIESRNLDEVVNVPDAAVGVEGSSIYLKKGEKLTVKELLFGLMLSSGNDAAVALAIDTAGSIEAFAEKMNAKADELGLKNTHFVNPHGLEADGHYTSAYDLAVIAANGMKNPTFREIVATQNVTISGNSEENTRYLHNKNKILASYNGGNGVKTGYTKAAGRCLIAASLRNGMQVVSVVLNRPAMFEEASALMDYAHNNYEMKTVVYANESLASVAVGKGFVERTDIVCDKDIKVPLKRDGSETADITLELPESINAPHFAGDSVGVAGVNLNNRLLFSEKLYTIEDIEERTFIDDIKNFFGIGKR